MPLTITASNTRPDNNQPDNPESLVQTSAHVWTITRATDTATVTTYFTINGVNVSINSTDSLETLQNRFSIVSATTHVIGEECEALRRDIFAHVASFGDDTAFDPATVYIQLDMTEKRAEPIHRRTHTALMPWLQIETDESTGLYFGGLHGTQAGSLSEPNPNEALWNFSAFPLSDLPYADPEATIVQTRVVVRLCNGKWSLETNRSSLYDLWLPITDDPVGDRPEKLVFEWNRPYTPNHPDDDGTRPHTDTATANPDWDLSGKRITVHILANPDTVGLGHFVSGGTVTIFGQAPQTRALHVESSGWTGANDALLNVTIDKKSEFSIVDREDNEHDLPVWIIGINNRHADYPDTPDSVSFALVVWSGSYSQYSIDPRVWRHHRRRVELIVDNGSSRIVFVPADGERVHFDEWYNAPIEWVYDRSDPDASASASNATITTHLSFNEVGDCPDYEDQQHDSPLVFKITYKNETLYLPRISATQWSRIITIDGESLAFCFEYNAAWEQPGHLIQPDAGWQLTVYHADDIELPWKQVYRFLPTGPEHAADLDELPPFMDWKPYAENTLTMVWRRTHDDDQPASVTALALPVSHPAGTATWTWSESTREWTQTADNSASDYIPVEPLTRASIDGATRTTVSTPQPGFGFDHRYGGWWSPDGVTWELIVDGSNAGLFLPEAPTHTPTGPGDSYRALCGPPPPPPITGDCLWQWNGSDWINTVDDCGIGKRCDPPTDPGNTLNEIQAGSCTLVDCGGKKARYMWFGGVAPAGWTLLDHECPDHCVAPGGPSFAGAFIGEIVFVDCQCVGC